MKKTLFLFAFTALLPVSAHAEDFSKISPGR
jgi:hypothetical protein